MPLCDVQERLFSMPASAEIGAGLRVKYDATYGLAVCDAEDVAIGYTAELHRVTGIGASTSALLLSPMAGGVIRLCAHAAITQYATVYPAASGRVDDAANGNPIAVALEAATAQDDLIKCILLPANSLVRTAAVKTANYTVLAAQSGIIFTTVGASGAVAFALPAATVGLEYFFQVGAAQELRLDPDGTETIALPSTGVQGAAGKYLTANAAGETVHIVCTTAGGWSVFGYTGTWTAES